MKVAVLMLVVAMTISANAGQVKKRFFLPEIKEFFNSVGDSLKETYNSAKDAFNSVAHHSK